MHSFLFNFLILSVQIVLSNTLQLLCIAIFTEEVRANCNIQRETIYFVGDTPHELLLYLTSKLLDVAALFTFF